MIEKILIMILPILPHFSSECLLLIKPGINLKNISWPQYDKNLIDDENCNIVIQINGKKRGLIKLPKNSSEVLISQQAEEETNVKKYLMNAIIKKKIYVKNRLINFII